ncbi:MAG TPA: hypothetical protein VJ124_27320 [Pyrinomonadaceae bacterium]|nr:hypothetical protein [Pyrinomonadaceae bacterium]
MYCATCGIPLAPGLSFCNRCGASLRERQTTNTAPIAAFLTAITVLGVIGLGIMLGGAVALRNEAHLAEGVIILFMTLTFLIVSVTEVLLVRQLSRLTDAYERKEPATLPRPASAGELPPPLARDLAAPFSSVTENTTRTLEYSQKEPGR